jgi:hypothetical protein
MKGLFVFTVLILTTVVSVFYSLTLLDNIVHGSLYNYGLTFSYDWANPYWMTLKIVQALLGLTIILTLVNTVYVYKIYGHAELRMPKIGVGPKVSRIEVEPRMPKIESKKPEIKVIVNEKSTVCPPTIEQQLSGVPQGMVKCGHCGKIFAQPLRMLEFHEDRPRMINICPFCNELIQPTTIQK